MNADIVVTVHGRDSGDLGRKIEAIDAIARTPKETPPGPPVDVPDPPDPLDPPDPPDPPVLQKPYFDIGDATGKAGEIVTLSVEAGCRFLTTGFHIGGGCGKLDVPRSGYGLFEAVGWKLGDYLTAYLKSVGGIEKVEDAGGSKWVDNYWNIFQMLKGGAPTRALPEEWWELALAFFSMSKRENWDPVTIPSGTELFTLDMKILDGTAPGEYEVTCGDERYWTKSRVRRRDFLFTANRDSPFARGGITKLELIGGKITVTA